MTKSSSKCRICLSDGTSELGIVEYFNGYPWPVYKCNVCGCVFTRHDSSVHDTFHSTGAISYYEDYKSLAAESQTLFAKRDLGGLERLLVSTASKYKFIIDSIQKTPKSAKLLEIGCSRGYLCSWSILDGRDILGVDVSTDAINTARSNFGDHFALADSTRAKESGPFDLIYHVGVIGCVEDPVGLSKSLIEKLKPGGHLIFNAPNSGACYYRKQLWLDSAPPPDLVTLFPSGFWQAQIGDLGKVEEQIECSPSSNAARTLLARLPHKTWKKPVPQPLQDSRGQRRIWTQPSNALERLAERVLRKLLSMTGAERLVRMPPSDFGLFVTFTKH